MARQEQASMQELLNISHFRFWWRLGVKLLCVPANPNIPKQQLLNLLRPNQQGSPKFTAWWCAHSEFIRWIRSFVEAMLGEYTQKTVVQSETPTLVWCYQGISCDQYGWCGAAMGVLGISARDGHSLCWRHRQVKASGQGGRANGLARFRFHSPAN